MAHAFSWSLVHDSSLLQQQTLGYFRWWLTLAQQVVVLAISVVGTFIDLPSGKLTWQWKIPIFNREYIFNRSIFHCHVSLPEGRQFWNRQLKSLSHHQTPYPTPEDLGHRGHPCPESYVYTGGDGRLREMTWNFPGRWSQDLDQLRFI